MTTANVYQQRPDSGAKAESSLHHAHLAKLIGKGRKNPGVTVREKKLLGHLTLRGDAKDPAFAEGVHKALGLELPVALSLVAKGDSSLQWMGPDEWLLIVPGGQEYAVEQALRAALAGLHISVVNVSGGQQLLELSGPNVRNVLMKSTSYDVHPDNFPVGSFCGALVDGLSGKGLDNLVLVSSLAVLVIALLTSIFDARLDARTACCW